MSKIKNIIIILVTILVMAIIALVIVLGIGNRNEENIPMGNEVETSKQEQTQGLTPVESREDYYIVKDNIGKYYSYYSILFNARNYYATEDTQIISQAEKDNAQILYNMLDTEYITAKGITADNLKTNLTEIGQVTAYINNMYVIPETDNIDVYVVSGELKETVNATGTDFELIVKLDKTNKTFSVMPQEYVTELYGNIVEGQSLDINVEQSIAINANNTYTEREITEETYLKDLFAEIRNELLNDYEEAYNHLDEEYRTQKFATLEDFNNFASEKAEEYRTMALAQYQVTEEDGYTQYLLVDQNGKYYIANETAVMKYTTLLDTYTVDLPQFTESYNSANDSRKAGLNLQKVVDAINNNDYEYVYNKLDETFRANNFPTLESFEQYIQNNLYTSANVEFSNYQNSGELHIFDATFTDKNNESSNAITKTFIVKLLEGTDFVMSFNV